MVCAYVLSAFIIKCNLHRCDVEKKTPEQKIPPLCANRQMSIHPRLGRLIVGGVSR